jgi:UDP-N-acetylglucosamine 1-carboxyvinyltransferase
MCRFGAAFTVSGDKAPTVWAPDGFSNAEVDLQDYVIDKVDNAGPEYSGASKAATLCASLGAGESVLRNPYTKCESQVLLENLRKNRVDVTQLDATSIALTPGYHTSEAELPCTVVLPPDLLEIATWVTAVGIVGGCVVLDGVSLNYIRDHLTAECMLWETVGIDLREQGVQSVVVQAPTEGLLPRLPDIVVSPRGIYSDCQPMFAALSMRCEGNTWIRDRVWASRYSYVEGLRRMGANIAVERDGVVVGASRRLTAPAERLQPTDIRCAAAYVLGALRSRGTTHIANAYHLYRGYSHLYQKIGALGVKIDVC